MRKTWIMIAVVLIMNSHSVWSEQVIGESDYLDNVNKLYKFSEDEGAGIYQHLIEGNDLSLYGLSNAVTRQSQDVADYDRATELEGKGYEILTMPPHMFNRINQPERVPAAA